MFGVGPTKTIMFHVWSFIFERAEPFSLLQMALTFENTFKVYSEKLESGPCYNGRLLRQKQASQSLVLFICSRR